MYLNLKLTEELLPLRLSSGRGSLSDADFEAICAANPFQRIERDSWGNLVLEPPVHYESGQFELAACSELYNWVRKSGLGAAFASQTGFTLPNGAIRAPDASWLSEEQLRELPPAAKKRFARVCPDFVIEVRSDSDRLRHLQAKMREYIANGCRLAFLIDPVQGQAWVYRPEREPEFHPALSGALGGDDVLPGFELDLSLFRTK